MLPLNAFCEYENSSSSVLLYVSPAGDDRAEGGIQSPLRTLKGARDRIRELKAQGVDSSNGFTVVFREGHYPWTETVTFSSQDSGTEDAKIVYRSYPGEEVVFTGGTRVYPEQFEDIDEFASSKVSNSARSKVKRLNIKKIFKDAGYTADAADFAQRYDHYQRADNYGRTGGNLTESGNIQMYYDKRPLYSFDGEQAMWLARFPNREGGYYEEVNPYTVNIESKTVYYDDTAILEYTGGDEEVLNKIKSYAHYDNIYLLGNIYYVYEHEEEKVKIDAKTGTITIPTMKKASNAITETVTKSGYFYLFNILEELDDDGEYYIDASTGMMYVYREDFSDTYMNVAMFEKNYMIKTSSASHITFKGISFENTKGSVVYMDGGESVVMENCSFINIGMTAAEIGSGSGNMVQSLSATKTGREAIENNASTKYQRFVNDTPQYRISNWGKNHGLQSCQILNTGAEAVELGGGNFYRNEECGYFVRNCEIKFAGMYERTYAGAIQITYSHGVYIEDNTLAHIPGAAIQGTAYKMLVKGNNIYDGMYESFDNGLIYINYHTPSMDMQFIDNYFHDVPSEIPRNKYGAVVQRAAIAFDNAPLAGSAVYKNNVFENLPKAIFYGNGNVCEDNLFVNCYVPLAGGRGAWWPEKPEHFWPNAITWRGFSDFRSGEKLADKTVSFNRYSSSGTFEREDGEIVTMRDWDRYRALLALPIYVGDNVNATGTISETEEEIRTKWKTLYPQFMRYVEILENEESKREDGVFSKGFMRVMNNTFINMEDGTAAEPYMNKMTTGVYELEHHEGLVENMYHSGKGEEYEISGNEFLMPDVDATLVNRYENKTPSVSDWTTILTSDGQGNYKLKEDFSGIGTNTLDLSEVGADENVGAKAYINSYAPLPTDTYSTFADAIEYSKNKVINVCGKEEFLKNSREITVLMQYNNEIIYADQQTAEEDGSYSFSFKTECEDVENADILIYAGGRLISPLVVSSADINDVIKPEFSAVEGEEGFITITMKVDNSHLVSDYNYAIVIAGYEEDGTLCNVKQIANGVAEKEGITELSQGIEIESVFSEEEILKIGTFKVYLWDGLSTMRPLAECSIL